MHSQAQAALAHELPPEGSSVCGTQALSLEDVDDDLDAPCASTASGRPPPLAAPSRARPQQPLRGSSPGGLQAAAAQPLAAEQLGPLCLLLWGPGGQPPPSWQQGFFFSGTPGLGTGLVQLQGEPQLLCARAAALAAAAPA